MLCLHLIYCQHGFLIFCVPPHNKIKTKPEAINIGINAMRYTAGKLGWITQMGQLHCKKHLKKLLLLKTSYY